MTYQDLIAIHPSIDVFLELFKGIAPTMVALLAIIVNNAKARERDTRSRKDTILYNVKKEMLDKLISLSQLQWKCGAELIDYLSETNEKDREVHGEQYKNFLYESLFKAQEILDYYKTVFESFEISVNCQNVVEISRKYSEKLNNLCEEYFDTYKISCHKIRNEQLDILRDKVLEETNMVKDWTYQKMNEIAKSLSEQIH